MEIFHMRRSFPSAAQAVTTAYSARSQLRYSSPYKMGCRSIRRFHDTGIGWIFPGHRVVGRGKAECTHQLFVATPECDSEIRSLWYLALARKTWRQKVRPVYVSSPFDLAFLRVSGQLGNCSRGSVRYLSEGRDAYPII